MTKRSNEIDWEQSTFEEYIQEVDYWLVKVRGRPSTEDDRIAILSAKIIGDTPAQYVQCHLPDGLR